MSDEVTTLLEELNLLVLKVDEAIREFMSLVGTDVIDPSNFYFEQYSHLINERKKLDAEIFQIRMSLLKQ
jgi:hypothetical protein